MACNETLAKTQNLSPLDMRLINHLHKYRKTLEEQARKIMQNPNIANKKILTCYENWYENEKLLQLIWHFKEDTNYIKFWKFPACTCPRMDNNEAYPTGYYIISSTCQIHKKELN